MGKLLASFKENFLFEKNIIKTLDEAEYQEVYNSIRYLILLYREDSLFIRHALNYIDLFDSISHVRNASNTGGDIFRFERIIYPEYLFGKSFFVPFIFTDLERVIGNYLSSSRSYFDVISEKYKYDYWAKVEGNNAMFFVHHFRNYFQHQHSKDLEPRIKSWVDFENNKLRADCALTVSSKAFNDDLILKKIGEEREAEIRNRITNSLPSTIDVFEYISMHMKIMVGIFYELSEENFSITKTKEVFDTLHPFVNDNKVGLKIIDEKTNQIDTFQSTTMYKGKYYSENLSINSDELIFLNIILNNLVKLPTKIVEMKML